MRKEKHQLKTCPFYDEVCKKQGCELYNERLQRCVIDLLAYNLYLLSKGVEQQLEGESQ